MLSDKTRALNAIHDTLEGRSIVVASYHGSRLYGTSTATSDMDVRVVCLPTAEEILTGKIDYSLDNNPDKRQLGLGDVDVSVFSFARYLRLLGKFDVNAIEMLFAAKSHALIEMNPTYYKPILENSDRLIGMGGSSPIGHARAVVGALAPDQDDYVEAFQKGMDAILDAEKRMGGDAFKLHQAPGLLDALRALPGATYRAHAHNSHAILEADIPDDVIAAGVWPHHSLFINVADRMIATTMTIHEVKAVLDKPLRRMKGELAARRARLEGTATSPKDIYHAIRILNQFVEIQNTGALTFPRPETATLMGVRNETIVGEDLKLLIDASFHAAIEAKKKTARFPDTPDTDLRTRLIVEAHYRYICAAGI